MSRDTGGSGGRTPMFVVILHCRYGEHNSHLLGRGLPVRAVTHFDEAERFATLPAAQHRARCCSRMKSDFGRKWLATAGIITPHG